MSNERTQLPPLVEQFWSRMRLDAGAAAGYLHESWQLSVRHDKTLERLALWHTVNLELDCENTLRFDASPPVLPLKPVDGSPEVRYEVEAAIQMVPRLIPFVDFERSRLRALPDKGFEDWGEAMAEREPGLVAKWHRWLWVDSPVEPYPEGDHGRASELAIAASRLADGVNAILGWNGK